MYSFSCSLAHTAFGSWSYPVLISDVPFFHEVPWPSIWGSRAFVLIVVFEIFRSYLSFPSSPFVSFRSSCPADTAVSLYLCPSSTPISFSSNPPPPFLHSLHPSSPCSWLCSCYVLKTVYDVFVLWRWPFPPLLAYFRNGGNILAFQLIKYICSAWAWVWDLDFVFCVFQESIESLRKDLK